MVSLVDPEQVALAAARVILVEPLGVLHYSVPAALAASLSPGVAVRAPLGKRTAQGYVLDVGKEPPPEGVALRELAAVDLERPSVPRTILELVLFAADYYAVAAGEVLSAALPSLARSAAERFRLTKAGAALAVLGGDDDLPLLALGQEHAQGFTLAAVERALGISRRSAAQRVRRLLARGLLVRHEKKTRARKERGDPAETAVEAGTPPPPTADQESAIAAIVERLQGGGFAPFLLHGITGSGKTEVYLRVIERALALGKSALVLVPEIALTPQLGARFRQRFGEQVATFHSGLTPAQRRDEWERVQDGSARIGLGARSALFLPLHELGVVIVDEEHETTFKQDESPRYNARDLAVARAKLEGAVVVLGSATPSLETRSNADAGRYQVLRLPARVLERPLPEVELVDLAKSERQPEGILTQKLATALAATIERGEQAILFLNRRGFAPYVSCKDCGHTYRCGECDVSLTLHKRRGVLACHYCGYEEPAPDRCQSCDGHKVSAYGLGVERLEDELLATLGDVKLARLDRDTVRSKKELDRELGRFHSGEAQILLGTQMVTKGHDFPGVTLVGVAMADASLNFPDFRAAERTFQLLTQVAGRAGRGERPGKVLVQTFSPTHYAVRAAAKHDYDTFYAEELAARRELGYPPFSHLALVRCEGLVEADVIAHAEELGELLRKRAGGEVSVLGPAPAPLARLRGNYRVQLLIKSKQRKSLRAALASPLGKTRAGVRQILDVDPYGML